MKKKERNPQNIVKYSTVLKRNTFYLDVSVSEKLFN